MIRIPFNKLTRLVLLSFIGPFVLTFCISLFVLTMQFLFKYIDDLIGKGLETMVIIKLILLASATLVPLALPLAILVSSIMTFGNLAEHFEIVAAKSAGISLQRLMRPLILTAILIGGLAFYFSNYILPWCNLKMGSLLYDVRQQKPALYIKEGAFYNGIDDYSIKIGKKGPDGQTIYNVMIYDHRDGRGNIKVTTATSGKMAMTDDKSNLLITLFNGSSYEEQNKKRGNEDSHPLLRYTFKEEVIRFDLSSFKLNRTDENLFRDNNQMMNLWQLSSMLDTFYIQVNQKKRDFYQNIKPYFAFSRDSSFLFSKSFKQSASINPLVTTDLNQKKMIMDYAMNQARGYQSYVNSVNEDLDIKYHSVYRYKIEWHRKFVLSVACLILFLIGAPLGAIIRKGGFGLPIVISIIFFLLFHIISITGEKFAKEGVIEAYYGMWIAPAILLPFGIFLLYKATHDSGLFDVDIYLNIFKKFRLKKE